MVSRAVSTVLDAAVCLLLVTAAVGVLTMPATAPRSSARSADATAETLAAATAQVNYSLAPGARHADDSLVAFEAVGGPEFRRTAHGTLANLLADAALGNATLGGRLVTHAGDGFERALRAKVRNATGHRTVVRSVWTPYRGAPVGGRLRVGRRPPGGEPVAATSVSLDSGCPTARNRARAAANESGYAGVARVVARASVRCLFPPRTARLALHGDYPVDALVRYRYRRFARLLGTSVDGPLDAGSVRTANDRLVRALTDRYRRSLRARYESPAGAAAAVRVGEVRIVVRRW